MRTNKMTRHGTTGRGKSSYVDENCSYCVDCVATGETRREIYRPGKVEVLGKSRRLMFARLFSIISIEKIEG